MRRTPFAHIVTAIIFFLNSLSVCPSSAQDFVLSKPGEMVHLSLGFSPPILKGIKVNLDNPFRLDFILDKGDGSQSSDQLKEESLKLVKYFLASITIPENDLWVNLSPYEKDRIVPEALGVTEMGRDLLTQDYMLKQITASVIYPEGETGRAFWGKIYAEAQKRYGTSDIPVDTFNKVWIVPQKAVVYESKDSAYVVESRLKVMLEEDYLAFGKNKSVPDPRASAANKLGSDIVREVVIPVLEHEVNEGKNFAQLRQIYHSLILAVWYKDKVKQSIFGKIYVDQRKTGGVDIEDKAVKDKIWAMYVDAFKKGAYNYIKEETDQVTQQVVPRKYFSGGAGLNHITDPGVYRRIINPEKLDESNIDRAMIVKVGLDTAMKKASPNPAAFKEARALSREQRAQRLFTRIKGGWENVDLWGMYHMAVDIGRGDAFTPDGQVDHTFMLTTFLNTVFAEAGKFDDKGKKTPHIVFLKAGADPLYEAAKLMAKVRKDFPADHIHSIWATMSNYKSIDGNREQAIKFVKYLHDQKILSDGGLDDLLIVDTDTGVENTGTELIFAKTILDDDVIQAANERYGLHIRSFKGSSSKGIFNRCKFLYMFSLHRKSYLRTEKIPESTIRKMEVINYHGMEQVRRGLVVGLTHVIDVFLKLKSAAPEFKEDPQTHIVSAVEKPPYGQKYEGKTLRVHREVQYAGLLMGVLDVLEASGYDVQTYADQLIDKVQKALKTNGLVLESKEGAIGYTETQGQIYEAPREGVSVLWDGKAPIILAAVNEASPENVHVFQVVREGKTLKGSWPNTQESPYYLSNPYHWSSWQSVREVDLGRLTEGEKMLNIVPAWRTRIVYAIGSDPNSRTLERLEHAVRGKGDYAMTAAETTNAAPVRKGENTGGIDLTREKMDLQVEGGHSVEFRFNEAMIQKMQNALGLSPTIIDISPITITLPAFLGITSD